MIRNLGTRADRAGRLDGCGRVKLRRGRGLARCAGPITCVRRSRIRASCGPLGDRSCGPPSWRGAECRRGPPWLWFSHYHAVGDMTIESTVERHAPDEAIRLVLGVARLGELDLAGWWGCHGLDRVGQYVLSRSFRRTWQVAALELDILSASRRHTEAVEGRGTALHLFSDELPFRRWATAWLADQKVHGERNSIFGELESWDLADAHASLKRWAGREPSPEVVGSGLLLGELNPSELQDEGVLLSSARLLAACYPQVDSPFRVPYFNLRA